MASKRIIEARSRNTVQSVQINTNVEDPQKSIEELINVGVKNVKNPAHFQRNRAKLPSSFYQPRSSKTRGSSVGHSREGSSDDGFGSGRHTLSPSVGVFATQTPGGSNCSPGAWPHPQPGQGIVHQRQASAPALINYNAMEQDAPLPQLPQQPPSTHFQLPSSMSSATGYVRSPPHHLPPHHHLPHLTSSHLYHHHHHHARAISGGGATGLASLPPVAHAYSKSLNTMHHQQPGAAHPSPSSSSIIMPTSAPFAGQQVMDPGLPPIAHSRGARSCDFDAVGMSSGFSAMGSHQYNPQQPQYHQQQQQLLNQMPHSADALTPQSVGAGSESAAEFGSSSDGHGYIASSSGGGSESTALCWPANDPRAKSQSLDPLTLSTASVGHQPPHQSAMAIYPQQSPHLHQPAMVVSHQSFALPEAQVPVATEGMDDDGLGPLPPGWQKAADEKGEVYFIDHNSKSTTWYDPRIRAEEQEAYIQARHAQPDACEQPQSSATNPSGGDRVQQLRLERNYMLERQQQLTRAVITCSNQPFPLSSQLPSPSHLHLQGLVDNQQHQEPAYFVEQQQNAVVHAGSLPGVGHQYGNESAMEVDYGPQQAGYSALDPSSVVQDLNPNEFDRYLNISGDANTHHQPHNHVQASALQQPQHYSTSMQHHHFIAQQSSTSSPSAMALATPPQQQYGVMR